MGVRHKLNKLYINGVLILSALIGLAAESWAVFAIAAAIGIGLCVFAGDIRFHPRRRR